MIQPGSQSILHTDNEEIDNKEDNGQAFHDLRQKGAIRYKLESISVSGGRYDITET